MKTTTLITPIHKKSATYYGIALAVKRIVEAIVHNENSILIVTRYLNGQYGLNDLCLSVPTIVNMNGIKRIIDVPINDKEKELLYQSGKALKGVIAQLKI